MKLTISVICALVSCTLCVPVGKAQGPRDREVGRAVEALSSYEWPGAGMISEGPNTWDFALTPPMKDILAAGADGRPALLAKVSDKRVLDQVLFLLGGVGDETTIDAILAAMQVASTELAGEPRERVLAAGQLALSNITGEPVVMWYCGGVVTRQCQGDVTQCWTAWWATNKATFRASDDQHRRSRCRPGYGLYREPSARRQALSN